MVTKTKATFSERELELISLAFLCCKTKPDIDYDLMATKAGLKGAKSARDTFGPIWKKLSAGPPATAEGDDTEVAEPVSGKKNATPKKRKSAGGGDDGTPSKKKATPRKGRKASISEEKVEESGGEEKVGGDEQTLVGETIVKAEDGEDDVEA